MRRDDDPGADLLRSSVRRRAFLALCGALAATGHAPLHWPLLTLAAFAAALLVLARPRSARASFLDGWALGAGYFLVALHWIVEPFLVDAARHGWMAPFALVLLAAAAGLYWALAALAARLSAGQGRGATLRHGAAFAIAMAAAEMLRAHAFTGFPWAMPSGVWTGTPPAQLAALVGPYGLTLATLALAAVIAAATAPGVPRWHRLAAAAQALALAVGAWIWGEARLAAIAPPPDEAPVVRIVQANEAQALKWRADMLPVFWRRKLDLTAGAPAPDVVVWPEVALPYLLGTDPQADARIAEAAAGAPVLAGAQRRAADGRLLNALALVAGEGPARAVYDKHHLVPFGEYVPGGEWSQRLGLAGLATGALGGFDAGPGPALVDLRESGLGLALPLICYEVIFPRHAAARGLERPDWMLQVTNDAWFGAFAGPQQHLAQARMRAVEQGLPLVRAAQTGISAMIDPAGRVIASLPLDTAGTLDAPLPPPLPPTTYARWGEAPVLALIAAIAAGLFAARRRIGD